MIRHASLAVTFAAIALSGSAAAGLVFVTSLDPSRYYPERAQGLHVEGKTTIKCTLPENGRLTDCVVLSESPAGYGFGDAAIKMVTRSRVDIKASGLQDLVGRQISIPVAFELTDDPLPPAPPSDPVIASADGETPGVPEGEYEDSADGRQFFEGIELTAEDRAARQVHSSDNDATACPARVDCETQN